MSVSPVAFTLKSMSECLDSEISMWSKNGTVVEMSDWPVPSRLRVSDTLDSLVERSSVAVRGVVTPIV
jgi:hypothetical protein